MSIIFMLQKFKPIIRHGIRTLSNHEYHRMHVNRAKRILRNIELERGKTEPRDLKLSDSYALDVFGSKKYAPYLHVYSAIAGCFKEGWIPDNFYGRTVIPAMKGGYGEVSDLKTLTNAIFKSDAFPDVAYYTNELFLTPDYLPIPTSEVKNQIFKHNEKIVFKVDSSLKGLGVYFYDKTNFEVNEIKKLGNGVFQSFIHQHDVFNQFTPKSVATIRVTTVVEDSGRISVRACHLRLARAHNTHVVSKDHIRIPVNVKSGQFSSHGFLPNWHRTEKHPDSDERFEGNTIPEYSKCISTLIDLHKKVPFTRCIGWDVVVDSDNNIKLIEWNGAHNAIIFGEATQGPCYADLRWEKLGLRS